MFCHSRMFHSKEQIFWANELKRFTSWNDPFSIISAELSVSCEWTCRYTLTEWVIQVIRRRKGMCSRQQTHSRFGLPAYSCSDSTTLVLDCNPDIWNYLDLDYKNRLKLNVIAFTHTYTHNVTVLKRGQL